MRREKRDANEKRAGRGKAENCSGEVQNGLGPVLRGNCANGREDMEE